MNYELKEQDLAQIESFKNNKEGWLERLDNCISKLKAEKDPKNELKEENDPACERFKKRIEKLQSKLDYEEYSSFLFNYSEECISKEIRLFELLANKEKNGFRTEDVDEFRAYINNDHKEEIGYDMHDFLYKLDETCGIKRNLYEMLKKVREKHIEEYAKTGEESMELDEKTEEEIEDYDKRIQKLKEESKEISAFKAQIEQGAAYDFQRYQ